MSSKLTRTQAHQEQLEQDPLYVTTDNQTESVELITRLQKTIRLLQVADAIKSGKFEEAWKLAK
jgi:hypothetical protein